MQKIAIISTILMQITSFLYTIRKIVCRFEIWLLNLFKFNKVILGVVMYEISVPSLLASTLAHKALSFPLKVASHIILIFYATFYLRKKTPLAIAF